ncbi:ABC transporter ATP-binding protein [Viridibacillus sp. FSL R5-0477]|uniref:ABC transporter n=1 Tax=Viridibacillus arenosi FSL R5-213 TaxID=1227360 RepID=W4F6Q6_9BACL|nr:MULTISPECIES: ABC transporter ATP-binding protein [Viridibacillus]ETT88573.1 ABC transporter [Viridibacillus arenosi FSL R5-213]OMC81128.1 iron ABC transporter ATP-binding protein [Viridibacillus sp. FSL H8-0123]OMC90190.1 iron ABC transporter ATP-binding protein [Viridibacillus arenosi]
MLKAQSLDISYDQKKILDNFEINVEKGEIVSIIGPNGSGKSTALKAMSRLIPVQKEKVFLDGRDLQSLGTKSISKMMSVLFQSNEPPSDITVEELVKYGRIPHKKWYERTSDEDLSIVEWAIEKTGLTPLKDRLVASLSGGEAQRAWIAMSLAQRPKILMLDEPTTYLDIAHQLQLLELVHTVNRELGMTVVMVLHDLNQASIYSDKICVISKGIVVNYGTPEEVMTQEMIRNVYGVECDIDSHFQHGKPRINLLGISKVTAQ